MTIKKRIEYIIKHYAIIQYCYKNSMSLLFRFLGLFIKTDDKLVLLNSFGGRKFNDSPKVLFESMVKDPRFKDFKYVWAFEDPSKFQISNAACIKIDTLNYFVIALKAKIWISSVNIERGLHFKKKKTFYINTWHGAGTKKIGNACAGRKDYDFSCVDIMLVQSEFEREIFERDFRCKPASIRKIGFPRNDKLFHIDEKSKKDLYIKFNIPKGKKVILYAPTWRDSKDGGLSYTFSPPVHLERWRSELSDDYVLLIRMHAFTTVFEIAYNDFARDVSSYDDLNDILAITDVLVTDYSTIVYDAAIANIPFICFGFDYKTYKDERGFYYDLDQYYPGGVVYDELSVIQRIRDVVSGVDKDKFIAFKNRFIEAGGAATSDILKELDQKINIQYSLFNYANILSKPILRIK